MLCKKYLTCKRKVKVDNNYKLCIIWFKRKSRVIVCCNSCNSLDLCRKIITPVCARLDMDLELKKQKYTLYAIQEVPDYS
jgi:hypothetical protein